MATAKGKKQDGKLIAVNDRDERYAWAKKLGCTQDELRVAVREVGNSAVKVKEYLQARKRS